MHYKQFGSFYVISIEPGEEIIGSLECFCRESHVTLGSITGIGASNDITIGLFELATKTYHSRQLTGDHEITNLSGNISTFNGQLYLHVHATVSDANHNAFGGHLSSAVISGACEIIVQAIDGHVDREFNDTLGLNIFKLE